MVRTSERRRSIRISDRAGRVSKKAIAHVQVGMYIQLVTLPGMTVLGVRVRVDLPVAVGFFCGVELVARTSSITGMDLGILDMDDVR